MHLVNIFVSTYLTILARPTSVLTPGLPKYALLEQRGRHGEALSVSVSTFRLKGRSWCHWVNYANGSKVGGTLALNNLYTTAPTLGLFDTPPLVHIAVVSNT